MCIRINSIEVDKQKLNIFSYIAHGYNTTYSKKKSIQERLLSHEGRDSERFQVSKDACAALLPRRASRNFSKDQEEAVHDSSCESQPFLNFFLFCLLIPSN